MNTQTTKQTQGTKEKGDLLSKINKENEEKKTTQV
jgi:hypothetical protein